MSNEGEVKISCRIYSRIVGYLSAIDDWNEGKKQEEREREYYDVTSAAEAVEKEQNGEK